MIAPVMFLMILGIIEIGRAFMIVHLLSDVARESTRYAVVTEGSNKDTTKIQTDATNRLAAYGITTANTPTVSINDNSTSNLSTSSGPSQQTGLSNFGKYSNGSEVTVKIQVNFREVTWLPFPQFMADSVPLTGQYTLRRDPM